MSVIKTGNQKEIRSSPNRGCVYLQRRPASSWFWLLAPLIAARHGDRNATDFDGLSMQDSYKMDLVAGGISQALVTAEQACLAIPACLHPSFAAAPNWLTCSTDWKAFPATSFDPCKPHEKRSEIPKKRQGIDQRLAFDRRRFHPVDFLYRVATFVSLPGVEISPPVPKRPNHWRNYILFALSGQDEISCRKRSNYARSPA